MREVCADTGVNITQGKRVQRQVRYERLKEEFIKLIEKLTTGNPLPLSTMTTSKEGSKQEMDKTIRDLEETLNEERQNFDKKLKLYKD